MQTAIDARIRHHGLSVAAASDPRAGSVLGRLFLEKRISEPLCEAGEKFYKAHGKMIRATLGPRGLETVVPGASGDEASDDYVIWAIAAVGDYRVAKDRLSDDEWAAVRLTVLEDCEPLNLLMLKLGLICLARGYGLIRSTAP